MHGNSNIKNTEVILCPILFFPLKKYGFQDKKYEFLCYTIIPEAFDWLIKFYTTLYCNDMQKVFFPHCNNGFKSVPQCYVIRTLPVLLKTIFCNKYEVCILGSCDRASLLQDMKKTNQMSQVQMFILVMLTQHVSSILPSYKRCTQLVSQIYTTAANTTRHSPHAVFIQSVLLMMSIMMLETC